MILNLRMFAMAKKFFIYFKLTTYIVLCSSCFHSKDSINDGFKLIKLKNKLQTSRGNNLSQYELYIPSKLLRLVEVKTYFAPFREGPGFNYPIKDKLLLKKSIHVELDSYGQWTKVLNLTTGKKGWIYKDFVHLVDSPKKNYKIRLDKLPLFMTVKDSSIIRSFDKKSLIRKAVPKGSYFISLNSSKKEKLVWLEDSNSLAWLE